MIRGRFGKHGEGGRKVRGVPSLIPALGPPPCHQGDSLCSPPPTPPRLPTPRALTAGDFPDYTHTGGPAGKARETQLSLFTRLCSLSREEESVFPIGPRPCVGWQRFWRYRGWRMQGGSSFPSSAKDLPQSQRMLLTPKHPGKLKGKKRGSCRLTVRRLWPPLK